MVAKAGSVSKKSQGVEDEVDVDVDIKNRDEHGELFWNINGDRPSSFVVVGVGCGEVFVDRFGGWKVTTLECTSTDEYDCIKLLVSVVGCTFCSVVRVVVAALWRKTMNMLITIVMVNASMFRLLL